MGEGHLHLISGVLPEVLYIGYIRIGNRGRINKCGVDSIRLGKLEHPCQHHSLQLESTLMISVGQDNEDVRNDSQEVLLEEGATHCRFCASEIVYHFVANCTKSVLNFVS